MICFLRYVDIKAIDTANGPGVRVSLFVSGCRMNCKNCFNKIAQSFTAGEEYTEETENKILEYLNHDYVQGLSLLGGDPMEVENQRAVLHLVKRVKEEMPEKDIWLWTGRIYPDELKEGCRDYVENVTDEIFRYIDVVVDGRFVQELASHNLLFRGSSNQRIIYLQDNKERKEEEN